jgi:hypothetical protein
MGRVGRKAGNLVGRLERGDEKYPSLGLIADFLRGCRASFRDVTDLLDLYTSLPTQQEKVFDRALARVAASVPARWQDQVSDYDLSFDHPKTTAKPSAEPSKPDRLKRLERARKNAAAAHRRDLYGQFLKFEVNRTGTNLSRVSETILFNHGLEWFGILFRTRRNRPETTERQLAASHRKLLDVQGLPLSSVCCIEDAVRRRFAELAAQGELDWLPDLGLEEFEANLLTSLRRHEMREERRREFGRKMDEYDNARKAAAETVWREVRPLLDEAGVAKERRPVYRGAVSVFCSAALNTEPGSTGEQRQIDEHVLEPRWIHLGLDTALAQRVAALVLPRMRELAKSFPPNPRPRR